jgi:RNA-directed DNA polymerase
MSSIPQAFRSSATRGGPRLLKQWKRGTTMYRELRALGASAAVARQVAANSRRWWRNSGLLLNRVFPVAWFDQLGLPRLS